MMINSFTYFTLVLYFTNVTVPSILVGGNRAMPEKKPGTNWLLTDLLKTPGEEANVSWT